MGAVKTIIVSVPDIRYHDLVSKELVEAAWLVTHQLFSVMRLHGHGRLSSTILRQLLGPGSSTIMDKLVTSRLIKPVKGHSSQSKQCREYRFQPLSRKFCCKSISDPDLVARWNRRKTNRKDPNHTWLDGILGDPSLVFDKEGASKALDEMTEDEFKKIQERKRRGRKKSEFTLTFSEYKEGIGFSLHRAGRLRAMWQHDRMELSSVDEFGSRYHHPITSLPKKYRRFFSWDGKGLVNVDVKNSQPLFLCLAYKQANQPLTDDWKKYTALCEGGTVYESLNKGGIDREEFKTKFFKEVLFAKANSTVWSPFAREFKAEFPAVFDFIRGLKNPTPSRQLKSKDKRKPHRLAAKALQRAESGLMFGGVIAFLRQQGITPVIPIHDSILTTPDKGPTVQKVIEEEFAKVGFKCGIRIEPT